MLEAWIEKRAGDFRLRAAFTCGEEFMGILGASGSGKSMTLKCIAGIEKPDRGRIVLDGRVLFDSEKHIDLPPQKRKVGYLFQNGALFPGMTVKENILCGLHAEKDKRKKEAAAEEIMELLQIREIASLRPEALSGGQTQRAALGRMLVSRPDLLLLDEPFSSLDAHLRLKLQMELKDLLSGYAGGIIMVTHDRDEAFRMCGRTGVMAGGKMLAVKNTAELFADPETVEAAVLTGCKNIAKAEKTGEYEVFVPGWNIRLTTAKPVKNDLAAVGIRAHAFTPGMGEGSFPVVMEREMEEPFAWVREFRFAGQDPETAPVWWRYPKKSASESAREGASECPSENAMEGTLKSTPERLVVSPKDVLLLYRAPEN